MKILETNGLAAESSKCKFAEKTVTYIRHEICDTGIKPKAKLVEAIVNSPTPKSKDELGSFLGLAEFYSKFVNQFSQKTFEMRQLMKCKTQFSWSEACQNAFQEIKTAIANAPTVQGFNPSADTFVTTDASGTGLGGVLSQISEQGVEVVIAFTSRSLSPCEEKYSVIERETLACVWALEHFRKFIWGKKFVLRSDHKPITKLLTTEGLCRASARIARLSMRLQDFVYKVQYVPGAKNVIADILSRLPIPLREVDQNPWNDCCVAEMFSESHALRKDEWELEVSKDEILKLVKDRISNGWSIQCKTDPQIKPFWEVRNELSIDGQFVCRADKIIPPKGVRLKIINIGHEGHPGVSRTKKNIKVLYWWPGIDLAIEILVRECVSCEYADKSQKTLNPPLSLLGCPNLPWEELALDIMGPVTWQDGLCKHILVLVDLFSRWIEVKVVEQVNIAVVIQFLDECFIREGLLASILTDNGVQFKSDEKKFMDATGIKQRFTALYYPRGNSVVERVNRVINGALQLACKEEEFVCRTRETHSVIQNHGA